MRRFILSTRDEARIVKSLINEMYGIDYEARDISEIAQAIEDGTEVYFLCYEGEVCIGLSGASIDNDYYADIITPDVAVLDYIYVREGYRNIDVAFNLAIMLIKELVSRGLTKAIMQVQTYNKQRFFHYALSDKNIIKTTIITKYGQDYEDQILLIDDIKRVSNVSIGELMEKVKKYLKK